MSVDLVAWRRRKELAWRRVWEDLEIGYLDRDLLPVIVVVNSDNELFTTSSCSGRIVVMDADYPWTREETGIIFKSHVPVRPEDLAFLYRLKPHKKIWVVVTGPILHVSSSTRRKAVKVLEVARRAGFKHSGIMHVGKTRGVFLELVTGIYVSQLIMTSVEVFVSEEKLVGLLRVLNAALLEGKRRLQRLYFELSKILPEEVDPVVSTDPRVTGGLSKITPIDVFAEMCEERGVSCEIQAQRL